MSNTDRGDDLNSDATFKTGSFFVLTDEESDSLNSLFSCDSTVSDNVISDPGFSILNDIGNVRHSHDLPQLSNAGGKAAGR